jgi:hypothetical protein
LPPEIHVVQTDQRWQQVAFPECADMYLQHLASLNLTNSERYAMDNSGRVNVAPCAYREEVRIQLSLFGALFASACIPAQWPWGEAPDSADVPRL